MKYEIEKVDNLLKEGKISPQKSVELKHDIKAVYDKTLEIQAEINRLQEQN